MLVWLVLVGLTIGLAIWLLNRSGPHAVERHGGSAEEVLRRRFASGEIDADEYERRLSVLRR